jgi:uncharacterized damage-inducible protein DinB
MSNELEKVLAGDSAAAPPAIILEGLSSEAVHQLVTGSPRTIYDELWHIAYWQQITLDWISQLETPCPDRASEGFPTARDKTTETWDALCDRFFRSNRVAAATALDEIRLDAAVRCPSHSGLPVRVMTVREQLESLGAHNAYHFGRIVLLRQMIGLWPPPSGGDTW